MPITFSMSEPPSREHAALKDAPSRTDGQEIALAVHEVANALRNLTRWLTFGNASSVDGHGALEGVIDNAKITNEVLSALAEATFDIEKNTRKPARRKAVRGPSKKKTPRKGRK